MPQTFKPTAEQTQAAFDALGLNRADRYRRVAQMVSAGNAQAPFETCCAALDRLVVRMASRKTFGRRTHP